MSASSALGDAPCVRPHLLAPIAPLVENAVVMPTPLSRLRARAVADTLWTPRPLLDAVERLGFAQADPIRAPATAQDLILRHRVPGYRTGDLETRYASLALEEDYLYAYGFLSRPIARLLHPRRATALPALERRVLDAARRLGRVHPRDLEAEFGRGRVLNAWGGHSKATTRALETLHYRGLLRVAGRESGIRVYEPLSPPDHGMTPRERFRSLVLLVARTLSPVPARTLRSIAAALRRRLRGVPDGSRALDELLRSGELVKGVVDAIEYVWPAADAPAPEVSRVVRFLAPFDPLVWARRRFEHLWGWPYRFEAYTPVARRLRGYYAMPLLWCDRVIGWANARVAGGKLEVELGFAGNRPRTREFSGQVDAEIARLEEFLGPACP